MKKALTILLAAAIAMSAAVAIFAADSTVSIVLGNEESSNVSLKNSLLTPGESYRFPVLVSSNGAEATPLTEELLKNYSFKISNSGEGDSVNEFKLVKINDGYFVNVDVKSGWPTEICEEEYSMKLSNRGSGEDSLELTVAFETGYAAMSDEYVASLGKDDAIEVNNDTPVFTTEQLKQLSKKNDNRKVTFEGSSWSYNVGIAGMESINMLHNSNSIKEIVLKYQDNSFEFLTFPAGTKFNAKGTVEIDASAFAEDFSERFFVYRYINGGLININCEYDAENETVSFNTDTLGRFVITDKWITDPIVIQNGGQSSNGSINNPNTGAIA